uniref:BUD13 homolog n=1 Tax=Petromyzon marinus TaxID=7757 RepID=S4RYL7_PETMA
VRIIDDDVDWRIPVVADDDANKAAEEEEVPLVAEFVDERPLHLQRMEEFRTNSKWKLLGQDDSDENTTDENTRFSCSPAVKGVLPNSIGIGLLPQRHDTDSDSDSGRAFKGAVIQKSPQNSNRHDSNSDSEHEPKTKNKLQHSKYNSGSDASPPWKGRERERSEGAREISEKSGHAKVFEKTGKNLRKHASTRHDCNSDVDSDSSLPQERKKETPADPRNAGRTRTKDEGNDGRTSQKHLRSPPDSDSDLSPVKRHRAKESGKSQKRTVSQGGLVPVAIVRKERERERKEAAETNALELQQASREASTVFRDRQGRVRDLQQEKLVKEQEAAEEQKRQEKYRTWGHGLAQVEAEQRSRDDDAHAASRPLARYRDDAELDAMLRAKMRDGDPMAKLLSRPDKSDKPGQAGPIRADKPKPRYSGPAPTANRYNIWPGHRWDGVDRSNGFETKRFTQISERKARNLEAHKWSVQDM